MKENGDRMVEHYHAALNAEARAEAAEAEVSRLVGWVQRAHDAEARAEQAGEQWAIMRKMHAEQFDRAEAAEKDRDFWQNSHKHDLEAFGAWFRRATAAEARLAECVREVREWKWQVAVIHYPGHNSLARILAKYTSATPRSPEQSDAVPKRTEQCDVCKAVGRKLPCDHTPTHEHPDTVRLRECVREIRERYIDAAGVVPVWLVDILEKYEVK